MNQVTAGRGFRMTIAVILGLLAAFWVFGVFGCDTSNPPPPRVTVKPDIDVDVPSSIRVKYDWDYEGEKLLWRIRGRAFMEGMLEELDHARFEDKFKVLLEKLGLKDKRLTGLMNQDVSDD